MTSVRELLDAEPLRGAIESSLEYLRSSAARASLERDPYWPKWDSPWWHMTLLWELGLAERIPRERARELARAIDAHCLHTFPFRIEDVPPGVDPHRQIICHCALGTALQVLDACGLDAWAELPWARGWLLRYQLPDGGLNCDEEAYLRPTPRSSVVSTLPPAEALLRCTRGELDAPQAAFLDRVAAYLCERQLVRSRSKGGRLMDPAWLEPAFPRFYFYDALRGLRFLARWAARRGRKLPPAALEEVVAALDAWLEDPRARPRRDGLAQGTWARVDDAWRRVPAASRFLLLEEVGRGEIARELVRAEWLDVRDQLGPAV